jgi:hypothetical protein
VDLVHPSCARGRGGALDQARATGLGRPHLHGWPDQVVRLCLTHVAHWFEFLPKSVPAHENHKTTRGTLLVLKMCMKFAVYSSRTRGYDGQIFVVRTINKLPQARRLLVLEQSLELATVDQELHDVITRQVPAHKLHALLANLKRLVWESLAFFTREACSLPPCLRRLKSRMGFDFASLTLLLFWILSQSF